MVHTISSFVGTLFSLLITRTILVNAVPNTVYTISNAETPSLDRPGLTPIGLQRADECIPQIFQNFNIGMILSCTTDIDGEEGVNCPAAQRTAQPIGTLLGLNISTCATGEDSDDECASDQMDAFAKNSTLNILIVWDSTDLDSLFENIDVDFSNDDGSSDDDDGDDLGTHPDIIYVATKSIINSQISMNCTGLDGPADGSF